MKPQSKEIPLAKILAQITGHESEGQVINIGTMELVIQSLTGPTNQQGTSLDASDYYPGVGYSERKNAEAIAAERNTYPFAAYKYIKGYVRQKNTPDDKILFNQQVQTGYAVPKIFQPS